MADIRYNPVAKDCDELKWKVREHPDLPIVFLIGEDGVDGIHCWIFSNVEKVKIGEVLEAVVPWSDDLIYTDRDEFERDLRDELYLDYTYGDTGALINGPEFEALVQENLSYYSSYWKDVILVYINN